IWDANKKTLFAARDRLGEKPFYYTITDSKFVFASEIKSLLMFPGIKRAINVSVLDKFLSLRYCPGNETMMSGIFKLKPGHSLKFFKGKLTVKKYWDLELGNIKHETENYYRSLVLNTLEDSVRMRLISEVPIGVYLSGGLDSSVITALASKALEKPVSTFSIGFGSENNGELKYARIVSERFGTNHKEIIIGDQSFEKLPSIVWYMDEPLGDPTIIPTYFISKATKKYSTVVLTGEGADELFSGYLHEKAMMIASGLPKIPGALLSKAFKLMPDYILNKLFQYPGSLGKAGRERVYEYFESMPETAKMYSTFVENFSGKEKRELYTNKESTQDTYRIFLEYFRKELKIAQKMLIIDKEMWLPDYILPRLDRMTMANSIEGRVPYLDHRLMEISMQMPQKFKLNGLTEKYILRKAAKDILPGEILERKKRPFITPINEWGEEGMKDTFHALFGKSFNRGKILNKERIVRLMDKYENSKLIAGRQIFSLIAFEAWARIFVDMDPSEWTKNLDKKILN
ncbi:MAG: asparagine synthase (glutamine-hydrolyzing), partial [Candidatus Aenigmarchaeota archaeon]|nr:asparagine synthase (glutamine-hydrolyzing) [Candidatus Aenigmarchaeota archaeon]